MNTKLKKPEFYLNKKSPTKSDLKRCIKMVKNEIKEWTEFIKMCEEKLTNLK